MARVFQPFPDTLYHEALIVNPPKELGMRPYTHAVSQNIIFMSPEGTLFETTPTNSRVRNMDQPIQLIRIDTDTRGFGQVVGELDFHRLYETLLTSGMIRQVTHHTKIRSGNKSRKDDLMTSDVIAFPIGFDPEQPRDVNYAVVIPGTAQIIGLTDTQMSPLDVQLRRILTEDAQEHGMAVPNTHRRMGPEIVHFCFNGQENVSIAPLVEAMSSQIEYSI